MISLFYKNYPLRIGVSKSPSWDNVRGYFLTDLKHVKEKFFSLEKRVKSNHILSRLIKHMNVDITKDIFSYVEYLDKVSKYIVKDFYFSSNINTGKIIEEDIFNTGSCLLIESDFNIDLFDIKDFRSYNPIKIAYHDGVGLSMNHPTDIGEELNYVVLLIDVKLLLVQYKYWAIERMSYDGSIDPSIFIYTIVLTNMIPEYLDMAILNRFFTESTEDSINTKNIYISNNDSKVNRELKSLRKRLKRKNMYYEEFLKNIPLVTNKDAYELLKIPNDMINTNNLWSTYLSRSEIMYDIITFLDNKGIHKNAIHISELRRILRRLKSSNKLDSMDLKEYEINILFTNDRLMEICEDKSL